MTPNRIRHIIYIRSRIRTLAEDITELESVLEHAKIAGYDSLRVSGSKQNQFENAVIRLADWREELVKRGQELAEELNLFDTWLADRFGEDSVLYLVARAWSEDKTGEESADELGIEAGTVYVYRSRIRREIEKDERAGKN